MKKGMPDLQVYSGQAQYSGVSLHCDGILILLPGSLYISVCYSVGLESSGYKLRERVSKERPVELSGSFDHINLVLYCHGDSHNN